MFVNKIQIHQSNSIFLREMKKTILKKLNLPSGPTSGQLLSLKYFYTWRICFLMSFSFISLCTRMSSTGNMPAGRRPTSITVWRMGRHLSRGPLAWTKTRKQVGMPDMMFKYIPIPLAPQFEANFKHLAACNLCLCIYLCCFIVLLSGWEV